MDILYMPKKKDYSMPRKPLDMIRDMVNRHLLVVSVGLPRYNSLMQVFGIVNWALIQDGKQVYLCGGVGIPRHIEIPKRRHASRTWGYLKNTAAGIIGKWQEMGFVGRMQTLLDHKLIITRPIRWIDAGKIGEQRSVSTNSPLGVTCACLTAVHAINIGIFLVFMGFINRRKLCKALKETLRFKCTRGER